MPDEFYQTFVPSTLKKMDKNNVLILMYTTDQNTDVAINNTSAKTLAPLVAQP